MITVGGYSVETRYVSDRKLTAELSDFELRLPGVHEVRVVTPGATGQQPVSSEPQTLAVQYPAPVLASLSFDTASAGRADVVVTATGTGFVVRDPFGDLTPTVARWNGEPVPTTVVSSTELRFTLGAAQMAAPGTFQVSLANRTPGGGTSAARAFTVSRPVPAITELPSAAATAGRPGFTLTIHGTGFYSGSTVEWNGVSRPAQLVSSSRFVGSEPNRLVSSTDGQYVYVGLDGAAAVRRVSLASLTANLQFFLGSGVFAGDMVALPGLPGSVAVSIHRRGVGPPL